MRAPRASSSGAVEAAVAAALTVRRHPRPRWEAVLLRDGERTALAAGGVAWRFGRGPAVLLVHGLEGRGSQLGLFVAPLRSLGCSVWLVDGPAHGDAPAGPADWQAFADCLREVAHRVGGLRGVVTHSLGATVAALARSGGLAVDWVVMLAVPGGLSDQLHRVERRLDSDERPRFRRELSTRLRRPLEDLDLVRHADRFAVPTLIVHDTADALVPVATARDLHRRLPCARLTTTQHLGHRGVLHDPAVVDAVTAFARDHEPAPAGAGARR